MSKMVRARRVCIAPLPGGRRGRAALVVGLLGLLLALFVTLMVQGPVGATFPGANGKIAFQGDNGIYVMDPDGNFKTKIAAGYAGSPAWSPDGSRIAYAKGGEVWTMNADGSGQRRLTDYGDSPTWSPDGTQIAFVRGTSLYKMRADGSGVTLITRALNATQEVDWSPDGRRIAFDVGYDFRTGTADVYVVDAGGGGLRRLTGGRTEDMHPSWSPDGKKIVFDSDSGIRVMKADGTDNRMLSSNGSKPVWSPDGKKILYADFHIYAMDSDGNSQTKVSQAYSFFMDWQPKPRCTILGTPRANRLTGTARKDVICGGLGDDIIKGFSGNDIVLGGGGRDTLLGGTGNDTIDGGSGKDLVSYSGSARSVRASLTTGFAIGEGSDVLLGIENLTGSDRGDGLTGSAGPNLLTGGQGRDTLIGMAGNDTLKSRDGTKGNDSLDGGRGRDRCVTDAREAVIRGCP